MDDQAAVITLVESALREYLQTENALMDAEDPVQFCQQILLADPDCAPNAIERLTVDQVLQGLHPAPFVAQLAVVIAKWCTTHVNPVLLLPPVIGGVTESKASYDMISELPSDCVSSLMRSLSSSKQEKQNIQAVSSFMDKIGGARGVLTLLGFRETVGSRLVAPLTRSQCLASFQQPHRGNTLSVGAKAFSKHSERSSSGWWGQIKGNDAAKNAVALAKAVEVLDSTTWKNVHSLPHSQAVMELRLAEGYGARWYVDDIVFRGFLEPPMEEGHERRWRH